MIPRLSEFLKQLIPSGYPYEIVYENSKTICEDTKYSSAFYFNNVLEGSRVLSKCIGGDHCTTYRANSEMIFTTLDLSKQDVNINDIRREFIELTETTSNSLQTTIQRTSSLINSIGRQLGIPPEVRAEIIQNISNFAEQYQAELDAKIKKDAKGKGILSGLNNFASSAKDFGTIATNSARAVTSLATAFTTLKGAFDTINDPDMST
jgi:hypothetical protein